MSKTSARRHRKRSLAPKTKPPKPVSDRVVYMLLALVGFFSIALFWMFTSDSSVPYWRPLALGYITAIAFLINFYTFQIYRGRHLENWKQALARVPLRFAGYGTKDGKPLEAAHDHPETRMALLMSILISAAILVGLGLLLLPGLV